MKILIADYLTGVAVDTPNKFASALHALLTLKNAHSSYLDWLTANWTITAPFLYSDLETIWNARSMNAPTQAALDLASSDVSLNPTLQKDFYVDSQIPKHMFGNLFSTGYLIDPSGKSYIDVVLSGILRPVRLIGYISTGKYHVRIPHSTYHLSLSKIVTPMTDLEKIDLKSTISSLSTMTISAQTTFSIVRVAQVEPILADSSSSVPPVICLTMSGTMGSPGGNAQYLSNGLTQLQSNFNYVDAFDLTGYVLKYTELQFTAYAKFVGPVMNIAIVSTAPSSLGFVNISPSGNTFTSKPCMLVTLTPVNLPPGGVFTQINTRELGSSVMTMAGVTSNMRNVSLLMKWVNINNGYLDIQMTFVKFS